MKSRRFRIVCLAVGILLSVSAVGDERAKTFDVAGLKLGMTLDEVTAVLKSKDPEVEQTWSDTKVKLNHSGNAIQLPVYHFNSPRERYAAPGGGSKSGILKDTKIVFAPESLGGGAVHITRQRIYSQGKAPLMERLTKAVDQKYGPPEIDNSSGLLVARFYGYNAEGELYDKSTARNFTQCDGSLSLWAPAQHSSKAKCSFKARIDIHPATSRYGQQLEEAGMMTVQITDWTLVHKAFNQAIAARQAELEAAQKNRLEQEVDLDI